jgi:hypothetical protein
MQRLLRICFLVGLLVGLAVGIPVSAGGPFVESNPTVFHRHQVENIGDGFGWTGANWGDLDGDGADDYGVTAPFFPHSGNRPHEVRMTGVILAYSRNAGMFVQAGIVIFSEWPSRNWAVFRRALPLSAEH